MKRIKIFCALLLIVLLIILTIAISPKEASVKVNLLDINYEVDGNESTLDYDSDNPIVAMFIEKYGSIVIELYPDVAPNTVNNFISLVKSGFYDDNTMHRLVPGFVLQGGDPTGTGSGGPNYEIKGEFTSNGFENNLSHEKWVVSMARESGNPNSAGSQFFICLEDSTFLDGEYATFGRVIDGFDNIDNIVANEQIQDLETGELKNNLIIKKALVDLKGKKYSEVEKNS